MYKADNKNSSAGFAKHQQGVAIITALLIVTIAATVSITISTRLQLDVRRTGNLIAMDQADFYLLEAEEWSQRILRQDKKDSSIDDLSEDWAIEIPPLPVDGGSIQGKLTDLHACINVNTLIKDNAVNTITQARLTQLFSNLGSTTNLTQVITDWIDGDLTNSNPNGAEDGYYMNIEKPYRTANAPLHSITELRLIKGFEDDEFFQNITPHLCAFATMGKDIAINVNTASEEVLMSLSADMTKSEVDGIIKKRKDDPFDDLKELTDFSKLKTIITSTEQLSVSSDYFLLRTQAIIGQANKIMYSVIYRDENGKTRVISRVQRTL